MEPIINKRDGRVQLVVVTLGGPRRHAILSCFERRDSEWSHDIAKKAFGEATPGAVDGFDVTFVDGVLGEAACSRARLEELAGDVLDALELDDAQRDAFGACAKLARPGNRRVLGCLLANLRAMRVAAASPTAVVVEDNVRCAARGAADRVADALRAAADDSVDLLYAGHLAHDDTMEAVAAAPRGKGGLAPLPEPRVAAPAEMQAGEPRKTTTKRGKKGAPPSTTTKNHELWGTYAYRASPALYEGVLRHIREGFPRSLFRTKRRDCDVTPVDKLLQRVARGAGQTLRALSPPAFFRMPPALPSKIHAKWDRPFMASTGLQLRLYGMTWADVWLTGDEAAVVAHAGDAEVGDRDVEVDRDGQGPLLFAHALRQVDIAAEEEAEEEEEEVPLGWLCACSSSF